MRVTKLDTFDNELVTVPNSDLANAAVVNNVANDRRRVSVGFGIGYDDDINQARTAIVEEGTRTGGISAEIGFRVFEQAYDLLDAPIRRVTAPDHALPATRPLEARFLPVPARVAAEAEALVTAT